MDLIGGSSMESPAQTPTQVLPEIAAPGMDGQSISSLVGGMESSMGGDNTDLIKQLIIGFGDVPPEQWNAALQQIQQAHGPQVHQSVAGKLMEAQAMIGQRSHYLPGNRREILDYGGPA